MEAHQAVWKRPVVTICVLVFADHPDLARRVLDSIRGHCRRAQYRLVVGANAVSEETMELLQARHRAEEIDVLVVSQINLHKCPMMRRMFQHVKTEYVWWFDDDSYIAEDGALDSWLEAARSSPPSTVEWGPQAWCDYSSGFTDLEDPVSFVRTAPWYRGLPPPSWRPGGKGEFNFQGLGIGDGRWLFVVGGCFMIRTRALHEMNWPDPRLSFLGEDVFLGEAIRQQGWNVCNLGAPGVAVNTEPRRGKNLSTLSRPNEQRLPSNA
jgi:GT2 family glycosyltransferase